jgi:hypothetical protein
MASSRKRWNVRIQRNTVLGVLGATGFLHEVFLNKAVGEHPTLLLVSAALLGVPVWLSVDERRQDRHGDADS